MVSDGVLPAKKEKDPKWRILARFTAKEVELLITDARIPLERRVAYALEFLTGLRTGEASALKWCDYEADLDPLGRLHCYASYNTEQDRVKDNKTEVPREVPVHPVLAKVLAE